MVSGLSLILPVTVTSSDACANNVMSSLVYRSRSLRLTRAILYNAGWIGTETGRGSDSDPGGDDGFKSNCDVPEFRCVCVWFMTFILRDRGFGFEDGDDCGGVGVGVGVRGDEG